MTKPDETYVIEGKMNDNWVNITVLPTTYNKAVKTAYALKQGAFSKIEMRIVKIIKIVE